MPAEETTSSVEEPRKTWVRRGLRGALIGASLVSGVLVFKVIIWMIRDGIPEDLRDHLTWEVAVAGVLILAGAWIGGVGRAVAGGMGGSFVGALVGLFAGKFVGARLVPVGIGLVVGTVCGAFIERIVRQRFHPYRTSNSSDPE